VTNHFSRNTWLKAAAVAGLTVASMMPARAGCISDCRDEYDSEVDSCRQRYDDPDEADDLRQCVDDAKEKYDDCKEECTS
jgi:hypothetical protein